MTERVELAPCPFCGGALEITKHFRDDLWRGLHRCPVVGGISFEWASDQQRIIDAWNTRTPAAGGEELREALEIIRERRDDAAEAAQGWEADNATRIAAIARVRADMCSELLDLIHALPRPSPSDGEVERLRGALEPFALVAELDIGDSEADEDWFRPMDGRNALVPLRVGDLRRALAALSSTSGPAMCDGCNVYPADPPSNLCPGCQAYKDHQQ